MTTRTFIADKLNARHEDFLRYCSEAGKNFVDELDEEDFIAYRTEYSVAREDVERLKMLLDFRAPLPNEKFSASQQTFCDDANSTLQKRFGVVTLVPYENMLLNKLQFSGRVRNCLRRGGYTTVAELLQATESELWSIRNFEQTSFNDMVDTLKDFFEATEELDEFLCAEALRQSPQINLVIAAFEEFSASVAVKSFLREKFAPIINALPADIKTKKARPFLRFGGLACADFFDDVPEDLILADLPEFLCEHAGAFEIDALTNFVEELHFDLRAAMQKILDNRLFSRREFEVVRLRAKGFKYDYIGKSFNVTRERIRQIEKEAVSRLRNLCRDADFKKLILFLHALTDGKIVLTLDDVKIFLDDEDAALIWFLADKIAWDKSEFHFDDKLKALVFGNGIDVDVTELLESLPDVLDEETFFAKTAVLANEKDCSAELIEGKLLTVYKRSGKFLHRKRLTITFECGVVLKERFPNGYKIADEDCYVRFVRYLKEIFDERTFLGQLNLDAKIGSIGVLCDRGKYIHPDFVHVPPEVIDCVKNFVDGSERTAFFYKEIFETLKSSFAGTQITNHYFLQGVIKFYGLPYILRKDYLTKSAGIDMGTEFDNFIRERGEVSSQEILVSFKGSNVEFLLLRCSEVFRIGKGLFLHASRLKLRDADFEAIRNFLRRNCSPPVNSRVLLNLFFEHFAEFLTRNEINDHGKLFGVLRYMFRDEFKFCRPYISASDAQDVNNRNVLLGLLGCVDEIKIEDVVAVCEERGIHFVAKTSLIKSLSPDFVRVDEFTLRRPDSAGITEETIASVVENIRAAVERNGGWQAAANFDDYERIPQTSVPWNSFLLESVASLDEDALYSIKNQYASADVASAIFVSEDFAEDDFKSFLLKVLTAEHKREAFRSENEIFCWLKQQGLCFNKLPKFLEGGSLKFLGV